MSSETGVSINKPVSVLKKSIKVNFRDIFKALGKAGVDANLTDAKLEGAVFEGANLKGTIFESEVISSPNESSDPHFGKI